MQARSIQKPYSYALTKLSLSECTWDDSYKGHICLFLTGLEQKELRPICFCLWRHCLMCGVSGLNHPFYLCKWFTDFIGVRSGCITTLLGLVTQQSGGLVAHVPLFANASSLCILVQQQPLFSPYHTQSASACPELFCKFTVLNSLESIPKKHSFHNTLTILANRTYTLIRIK